MYAANLLLLLLLLLYNIILVKCFGIESSKIRALIIFLLTVGAHILLTLLPAAIHPPFIEHFTDHIFTR